MADLDKILLAIEALREENKQQFGKLWEFVNQLNRDLLDTQGKQTEITDVLGLQNERLKAVENAVMGLIGTEHDMRQDGEWHSLRKEAVYSEMSKLGYTKSSGLDEIATVFPLMRDSEGKKTCSCRPNGRGTKNTRAVVIRIRME